MGRTMPKTKNIVVKDNALINASYNLELIEQRLILLAVAHSRRSEQTLTAATKITIGVSDYIDTYSTQGRGCMTTLSALVRRCLSVNLHTQSGGGVG